MDKVGFILLSLVNLAGIAACVWLQLQCRTMDKHWFLRAGVGLFTFGLLGQLLRNLIFLTTGNSPTDADIPLYVFKDIGGAMVAGWFAYMLILHPAYLGKLLSALIGHGVAVVDVPEPAPKPAAKRAPRKPAAKTAPAGTAKKPTRRATP